MGQTGSNMQETAVTKKKKSTFSKVLLVVLAVILLAGVGIGVLLFLEVRDYNDRNDESRMMVFATTLSLVENTSGDNFETIAQLPFGATVDISEKDVIYRGQKTYYPCEKYNIDGREYECDGDSYVETSVPQDLAEGYYREEYTDMFPLKEARELPVALRWRIIDYVLSNGEQGMHFTQDRNRIGSSIIKADLNIDGEQDYAVLLQADSQNRLIVLCYNPDMAEYYVAFSDYNYAMAELSLFDKGASIFIDSDDLVDAPNTGIMYVNQDSTTGETNDYRKYAVFYDPDAKMFRLCLQVSASESVEYEEESENMYILDEEYEEYEDEEYDEYEEADSLAAWIID